MQFLNCHHSWPRRACQNLVDGLLGMSKPPSNCQSSLQHDVSWSGIWVMMLLTQTGQMQAAIHEAAHVLLHVSRPCWNWYTQQVQEVQSAQDGVQQLIAWSTSWHKDLHLVDICRSMYDTKVLDQLLLYQQLQGRGDEQHVLGRLVCTYAAELWSHRLWSMARYDTCPECFAGLLSADPVMCVAAMRLMKQDWKILCLA